jgi:hypothetical protein
VRTCQSRPPRALQPRHVVSPAQGGVYGGVAARDDQHRGAAVARSVCASSTAQTMTLSGSAQFAALKRSMCARDLEGVLGPRSELSSPRRFFRCWACWLHSATPITAEASVPSDPRPGTTLSSVVQVAKNVLVARLARRCRLSRAENLAKKLAHRSMRRVTQELDPREVDRQPSTASYACLTF